MADNRHRLRRVGMQFLEQVLQRQSGTDPPPGVLRREFLLRGLGQNVRRLPGADERAMEDPVRHNAPCDQPHGHVRKHLMPALG